MKNTVTITLPGGRLVVECNKMLSAEYERGRYLFIEPADITDWDWTPRIQAGALVLKPHRKGGTGKAVDDDEMEASLVGGEAILHRLNKIPQLERE